MKTLTELIYIPHWLDSMWNPAPGPADLESIYIPHWLDSMTIYCQLNSVSGKNLHSTLVRFYV